MDVLCKFLYTFRYVVSYKNPAEVVRLTELSYSHVVAMDQVINLTAKK